MNDDFSAASGCSSDLGSGHQDDSQSSTFDDATSRTSSNTGTGDGTSSKADASLGRQETVHVRRSKTLVCLVLFVITTAAAVATFWYLQRQEDESLASQFEVGAKEVLGVSALNALHIFDLYKAEALQMTTSALTSGQEWPFVTMPFFEAEANLLITQTKTGQYLAVHPLVAKNQRDEWEKYAAENQGWIQNSYAYHGIEESAPGICPFISQAIGNCLREDNGTDPYFAPLWQVAPVPGENEELINYNGFQSDDFERSFSVMTKASHAVLSKVQNLEDGAAGWPESILYTPVHASVDFGSPIVAVITAVIPWIDYFQNVLPEGVDGILVVVNNDFQSFTFEIYGPDVKYIGPGDLHDTEYDHLEIVEEFGALESSQGDLGYTVHVYPTDQFRDEHSTNEPVMFTLAVVCIFAFTASVFILYDCMVERRQKTVMASANKSNAIVASLFPKNIRDRLLNDNHGKEGKSKTKDANKVFAAFPFNKLNNDSSDMIMSKPIADLFTDATVMFADISGFTAWSSVREPSQVFFLLESIYNSFDKLARMMKVFKVETIGDSYVAVVGLPTPRKDHAVVMTRFAHRCLIKMNKLVHGLELTLGPGTSDLRMRFGLHSGPVTAGVLRGERSRFQLFGDTVNTAARMESTGVKNRIQISKTTYDQLVCMGKSEWAKPRDGKVFAKGKGEMQTYWVVIGSYSGSTDSRLGPMEGTEYKYEVPKLSSETSNVFTNNDSNTQRLVLWNVENLLVPLKKLVASRPRNAATPSGWQKLRIQAAEGATILDEVKATIPLPNELSLGATTDVDSVVIEANVTRELVHFVSTVAKMYNKNPFHSFEHASHVTQSVTKLMSRVVTPDQIDYTGMRYTRKSLPQALHDYTYGITSDPLTQFAALLSALIHDVDHPGISNAQLVAEGAEMATTYKNKSVAEQNSVDLAWELLMEPSYDDLRKCIYTNQEELDRFRQLVVNIVMATDVMDKELGALRKKRWEKAFACTATNDTVEGENESGKESEKEVANRKATVVLEHMMQASDVCHTMQHWQIYTQWNERFFHECYQAYLNGKVDKDPSEGWYQGELGFFDFYVLPLAKKLKDCGVFGVSSDEYFNYAQSNRDEWKRRGKDVAAQYMEKYRRQDTA